MRKIVNRVRIISAHFKVILEIGSYLAISFINSRKLPWLLSTWSDSKCSLSAWSCFAKNGITSVVLVKTFHLFFSSLVCFSMQLSIDTPKVLRIFVSHHAVKKSLRDWLASSSYIFSLFFHFQNPPSFVKLLLLLFLLCKEKTVKTVQWFTFWGIQKPMPRNKIILVISHLLSEKTFGQFADFWILADPNLPWFWSSSCPFTVRFFLRVSVITGNLVTLLRWRYTVCRYYIYQRRICLYWQCILIILLNVFFFIIYFVHLNFIAFYFIIIINLSTSLSVPIFVDWSASTIAALLFSDNWHLNLPFCHSMTWFRYLPSNFFLPFCSSVTTFLLFSGNSFPDNCTYIMLVFFHFFEKTYQELNEYKF